VCFYGSFVVFSFILFYFFFHLFTLLSSSLLNIVLIYFLLNHFTDEFGFLGEKAVKRIDIDSLDPSAKERYLKQKAKQRRNLQKWELLIQLSENNEPSKKDMKKRISKGIPQPLRGKIWPLISRSKLLAEKRKPLKLYSAYLPKNKKDSISHKLMLILIVLFVIMYCSKKDMDKDKHHCLIF
jgi:hypothetical protein